MSDAMTSTITFRISDRMREQLALMAQAKDRSFGWIIREALEEYLRKNHGSTDKK